MNQRALVTITFTGSWIASTGGTAGGDMDDLVQRDADGLPVVPMSSVRGVLREAAKRLADLNAHGWDETTLTTLFGAPGAAPDAAVTSPSGGAATKAAKKSRDSYPGLLVFPGEARLAAAEREKFAADTAAKGAAKAELFARRSSTAISDETGTALARTLRAIETSAPMTLSGIIELDPSRDATPAPTGWIEKLNVAAAWTLAIGKGKNDGLGRVLLTIAAIDESKQTAQTESGSTAGQGQASAARRLVIGLEQTEKATFSLRSATEGVHDTRTCIPGSALLGWAAADYDRYEEPSDVFHSGKVRFGDARPLTPAGEVLWPMPQVVRELKHEGGGVKDDGKLSSDATVRDPKDGEQRERVKPPLVSRSGLTAYPDTKFALRTAMENGRPATGQLFGYKSLVAAPGRTRRYVAVIEADGDITADDWNRIRAAFDGRELLLGRARASGQGGIFFSTVLNDPPIFPAPPQPQLGRVVVWALSDLALTDEWGEAALSPGPALLGLGTGKLLANKSAIAHRRYAPWRSHLWLRDVEHTVIEAGGVLVFDIGELVLKKGEKDAPVTAWPAVVGQHRELGLGRIWINPPLLKNLRDDTGKFSVALDNLGPPEAISWTSRMAPSGTSVETPLFAWAKERQTSRRSRSAVLTRFRSDWLPELTRFYQADPIEDSPSRSQWNDVVKLASPLVEANDIRALLTKFADGLNQIAKGREWQKSAWLPKSDQPVRLRDWLTEELGKGDIHAARGLLKLSADAVDDLLRKARKAATQ